MNDKLKCLMFSERIDASGAAHVAGDAEQQRRRLCRKQSGRRIGFRLERSPAVGFPAAAAQRPEPALLALHRLEEPRNGRLQNHRSGRIGSPLGHPEEPSVHELRQDVQGPPLLLPGQHPPQSTRRTPLLPVRTTAILFYSAKQLTNVVCLIADSSAIRSN